MDECSERSGRCYPHSSCVNSYGSYKCVCDPGYSPWGRMCMGKPRPIIGFLIHQIALCGILYNPFLQISMSAGMVLTGVMRMPGVTTLQAATPAPAMMDSLEMGSGVLLPNRLQSHWSVNQDTSHGARGVWVSMKPFLYIWAANSVNHL